MIEMPEIDQTKCDGCGLCLTVCQCGALVMIDNVVMVVETEECEWCTECEAACPNSAIRCYFEIVSEES